MVIIKGKKYMIKSVIVYPNKLLTTPTTNCNINMVGGLSNAVLDIKHFDDYIYILLQDMVDTCKALPNAIGLAANQIWDNNDMPAPSIFIVKMAEDKFKAFINPVVKGSGAKLTIKDSCLSYPNNYYFKDYCSNVTVKYVDIHGVRKEEKYTLKEFGLFPIILQHEMRHLLGKEIYK